MKRILLGLIGALALIGQEMPPKHELGLTLGRLEKGSRGAAPTNLELRSGTALQANYGYRLMGGEKASLYGEVHMLASPLRDVSSTNLTLTRDVASLFVTPGLRLKFAPLARVAPYVAIGGGYALYEQSTSRIDGQPNSAPRSIHRGAISVGGGVDVRFWRFISFRAEIRDFYTGSPAFNSAAITGGQHNVVAGGGFVLRFR